MGYNRTADGTHIFETRKLSLGQAKFIQRPDGYEEMAMDASLSNSSVVVWNGSGDAGGDWTLTGQGESSSSAAHSGTDGLDSTPTSQGNETKLDYGSEQDIAGIYNILSFWMKPKSYPSGSDLQVLWKASGGGTKGNVLSISDYVSNFDLDVWQKVTISIADFELGDNEVQKLHFRYASKGGQHFYYDDIELIGNASGLGPYTFSVIPDAYEGWHIGSISLVISSGDTGWGSTAFANIAGGLENGIIIRHYGADLESPTIWSISLRNNIDLFGRLELTSDANFFDTERMVTFTLRPGPSKVYLHGSDRLDIILKDNLSNLTGFRAFVQYGKEDLPNG